MAISSTLHFQNFKVHSMYDQSNLDTALSPVYNVQQRLSGSVACVNALGTGRVEVKERRAVYGSDSLLLTSYCGSPGSVPGQFMWDL